VLKKCDIINELPLWCADGDFFVILHPVFSASRMQHISDLHSTSRPDKKASIRCQHPLTGQRAANFRLLATNQPLSQTQASDAMTSLLPRYEAKYMCNAGASNAGQSPCVQTSRELSYPLPIH